MLTDISLGIRYFARGFKLIGKPEIRAWVVMPLLINIALFGGLIWLGYAQFSPLVEWLMSFVPGFLDFLRWIIWFLIIIMSAIIVFFSFTPVANIVAAPFNALMSEKIEALLTGNRIDSGSTMLALVLGSLRSQLGKLIYILLWTVALLLFSLIPLINLAAPIVWVIFGSWMLSLEYLDYPMGNHELEFSQQKRLLRERKGLALG
ncbi:MAG: sulfate transporter CysZ, partial [Gammaproteobacteria bacterium]